MNHNHVIYDSDPHFSIDPISRKITNESSTKTTIIQHDHNSERFTFEMPRRIENHDMSLCNIVEIHYLNVEANTQRRIAGIYTVEDLQVKSDDENSVVCSWLLDSNATQYVGQLQFLVRFACAYESTGQVEYVWNTAIYSGISISTGIYNSDTPSDNPLPAFNFVTTINGSTLKFFVGTQEEYNNLDQNIKDHLFAIITDDKTEEQFFALIAEIQAEMRTQESKFDEFEQGLLNGTFVVKEATHATTADSATSAEHANTANSAVDAENAELALKANVADMLVGAWVTPPRDDVRLPSDGVYLLEFVKTATPNNPNLHDGDLFTTIVSYYKYVGSSNKYHGAILGDTTAGSSTTVAMGYVYVDEDGYVHITDRQPTLSNSSTWTLFRYMRLR